MLDEEQIHAFYKEKAKEVGESKTEEHYFLLCCTCDKEGSVTQLYQYLPIAPRYLRARVFV